MQSEYLGGWRVDDMWWKLGEKIEVRGGWVILPIVDINENCDFSVRLPRSLENEVVTFKFIENDFKSEKWPPKISQKVSNLGFALKCVR